MWRRRGSDLHFIGGYIRTVRAGDVIGHDFVGELWRPDLKSSR